MTIFCDAVIITRVEGNNYGKVLLECVVNSASEKDAEGYSLVDQPMSGDRSKFLQIIICMLSNELQHWLSRFMLEMRKKDGMEYPPDTLYQTVCRIMRFLVPFFPLPFALL